MLSAQQQKMDPVIQILEYSSVSNKKREVEPAELRDGMVDIYVWS